MFFDCCWQHGGDAIIHRFSDWLSGSDWFVSLLRCGKKEKKSIRLWLYGFGVIEALSSKVTPSHSLMAAAREQMSFLLKIPPSMCNHSMLVLHRRSQEFWFFNKNGSATDSARSRGLRVGKTGRWNTSQGGEIGGGQAAEAEATTLWGQFGRAGTLFSVPLHPLL